MIYIDMMIGQEIDSFTKEEMTKKRGERERERERERA